MTEEELVAKYDDMISKHARMYLALTGQQSWIFEDLKSESVIAFLKTVRQMEITTSEFNHTQLFCIKRAMRCAMRRFIWHNNGTKNTNKHIEHGKCKVFSEFDTNEDLFSLDRFDFMITTDDYSGVEFRDALDRLEPVERETAELLVRGYSPKEIAKIRGISRQNVYVTVDRLKKKFSDVA